MILVDRLPFLGGTSTAVLDTFYGFYTPGDRAAQGRRRHRGRRRRRAAAASARLVERPNTYGAGTGVSTLPSTSRWPGKRSSRGRRHGSCSARLRPGRRTFATAGWIGVRRYAGRPRGDVRARPSSTPQRGRGPLPRAGFGYETAGQPTAPRRCTTTCRMANVDREPAPAHRKSGFHAPDGEAAASRRVRPPAPRGHRPHPPIDGHDGDDHDPPRAYARLAAIVNATDPAFLTEAEIAGRRQALEYVRFLATGCRATSAHRCRAGHADRRPRDAPRPRRLPRLRVTTSWRPRIRRRDRRAVRRWRTTRGADTAGSTCRTGWSSASRTGRSSSAMRRTCSSPDAASARPTMPTRGPSMAQCMAWARRPGRRRRWRSRPVATCARSTSPALRDRLPRRAIARGST